MPLECKCDECMGTIEEGAETFCQSCHNSLDKQLSDQNDEVEELQNKIKKLEEENQELKNERH